MKLSRGTNFCFAHIKGAKPPTVTFDGEALTEVVKRKRLMAKPSDIEGEDRKRTGGYGKGLGDPSPHFFLNIGLETVDSDVHLKQ